jgi:protein TonB
VTAPIRVRTVTADYPLAARAAQLEGDVVLQAVVGADGRVGGVSVVRSAHPLLDDAAKKAVLNYRYTPAQRNGVPESATIRITVSFKMR